MAVSLKESSLYHQTFLGLQLFCSAVS